MKLIHITADARNATCPHTFLAGLQKVALDGFNFRSFVEVCADICATLAF
jgi:hypothetical protein